MACSTGSSAPRGSIGSSRGQLPVGATPSRAAHVGLHGREPGAGRGWFAKLADALERDDKRFLYGVLGIGTVAEHGEGDRVQASTVALEQHTQANGIAGLRYPHERGVVELAHKTIFLPRRAEATISTPEADMTQRVRLSRRKFDLTARRAVPDCPRLSPSGGRIEL